MDEDDTARAEVAAVGLWTDISVRLIRYRIKFRKLNCKRDHTFPVVSQTDRHPVTYKKDFCMKLLFLCRQTNRHIIIFVGYQA